MSENIRSMIDALADKDFSSAKTAFDSILSDKMNDALETRRIEIASSLYDGSDASEEEINDSEELSSEEE